MKITCPHCGVTGVDNRDSSLNYAGTEVTAAFKERSVRGLRLYKCVACGGGIRKPKRFRKDLEPVPPPEWAELEQAWEERAAEQRKEVDAALLNEGGEELLAYYHALRSRREEDKKSPEERKELLASDIELFDYSEAGWIIVADNPFGVVFDKGKSRIMVQVDEWGEVVAMPKGREAEEFLRSRPLRRSFGIRFDA